MLAFTVYYTMPIAYKENPRTKTVTVSTSEDKELKYSEYGPIYFGIFSVGVHRPYNRSMINVYINYEVKNNDNEVKYEDRYGFRLCNGNTL